MLAFSPPLFPTTYGWPLIDDLLNIADHQQDVCVDQFEANSYQFDLPSFPTTNHQILNHDDFPSPELDQEASISSANIGKDTKMVSKKLNHNASERDRRKRVNDLYAFLRSLLPMSSDQKVKVSIPGTVSRALKYIPQLQKEVDTLTRKKENLFRSCSSSTIQDHHVGVKKQSGVVESSVSVLGEKEVVIQMIICMNKKEKNVELLSNVLEYLEQEEERLVLVNATTFKCLSDQGMLLNTLHLQVHGDHKIEAEILKEKLCSFHR